MNEISNIREIGDLLVAGFDDWKELGDVSVKRNGPLALFNYTPAAQQSGRWNFFELVSRGLILDSRTGDVVARPFDKFFNWGEGGRYSDAMIKHVSEKVDGSLGIAYWFAGNWHVATRGSFDGEQATWATNWLRENLDMTLVDRQVTLLFEIVYPENRIVVDYGDTRELVLLAARNIRLRSMYMGPSYLERAAARMGCRLAQTYGWERPGAVLQFTERMDASGEGFVALFADGQRFKFKSPEYMRLHRAIAGLTYKNTVAAFRDGKLGKIRDAIPDEFLGEFEAWVDDIGRRLEETKTHLADIFTRAPRHDRKEFALHVQKHWPELKPYMFAMYDDRPVDDLFFKYELAKKSARED